MFDKYKCNPVSETYLKQAHVHLVAKHSFYFFSFYFSTQKLLVLLGWFQFRDVLYTCRHVVWCNRRDLLLLVKVASSKVVVSVS